MDCLAEEWVKSNLTSNMSMDSVRDQPSTKGGGSVGLEYKVWHARCQIHLLLDYISQTSSTQR